MIALPVTVFEIHDTQTFQVFPEGVANQLRSIYLLPFYGKVSGLEELLIQNDLYSFHCGLLSTVYSLVDSLSSEGQLMARTYEPTGTGPFPTVPDLHGGAWNAKDRKAEEPMDRAHSRKLGGILPTAARLAGYQ